MYSVLVANPKGGAGKSTLSTNVAAHYATQGARVMLGDIDRQQSARHWLALRSPLLAPISGWDIEPDQPARPPRGTTHVVIDTPAGLRGKRLETMLRSVDRILVPVQPSIFDILATGEFLDELAQHKRISSARVRIGIVGMRVDTRTRAAQELERFCAGLDLPVLGYLRNSQLYVQTAAHGMSIFDLSRSRAQADREQWQPIIDWLDSPMNNPNSKSLAVVRNSSDEEGMRARILCFAGSTREASFNRKLALAAARAVEEAGGEATFMDLRDHPLPLYDGDLEASAGLPLGVRPLKELFKSHDGLFIASPEYNGSFSAVLKNTLDWISRPAGDEAGTVPYAGKVAALAATSPGALGGLRGLVHLRAVLQSVGALVLSEQVAVGGASNAFSPDGKLADERLQQMLDRTAARLVDVAARLRP